MAYTQKDTTRLYWSKYAFKVIVKVDPYSITGSKKFNTLYRQICIQYGKSPYTVWQATDQFRIQRNHLTTSLYFENRNDAEGFITKHPRLIVEYERPATKEQETALWSEARVILRDQLFYNQFRYKAYLSVKTKHDQEMVMDWIDDYGHNSGWNTGEHYIFTPSSGLLYINDPDMILQLRLGLGGMFKNLDKVLLKNELIGIE